MSILCLKNNTQHSIQHRCSPSYIHMRIGILLVWTTCMTELPE